MRLNRSFAIFAFALAQLQPLAANQAEQPHGHKLGELLGLDAPAAASPAASASSATAAAATGTAAAALSPAAKADEPAEPLFLPGQTAVAYQVSEHLFGHENNVTGRNQAVTVTVEAQGDQRRVVVMASAGAFKTDKSMRDSRVSGYLGGTKRSVVISSAWLSAVSLTAFTQGAGQLAGTLEVQGQGKTASVTLTAQGDGKAVQVQALSSFKDLGLDPPSMMFMGEVHQPLKLSAQIQLGDVQGLKTSK